MSTSTNSEPQVFLVPGISCGHCAAAIRAEVGALAGVATVDVDLDTKFVSVITTTSGAERSAIVAAIAEAGYDVSE